MALLYSHTLRIAYEFATIATLRQKQRSQTRSLSCLLPSRMEAASRSSVNSENLFTISRRWDRCGPDRENSPAGFIYMYVVKWDSLHTSRFTALKLFSIHLNVSSAQSPETIYWRRARELAPVRFLLKTESYSQQAASRSCLGKSGRLTRTCQRRFCN